MRKSSQNHKNKFIAIDCNISYLRNWVETHIQTFLLTSRLVPHFSEAAQTEKTKSES